MLLFLKLYLAHLVADFLLQPNWIARNKRNIPRLALHAAIHLVVTLVLVNFDLTRKLLLVLLILAVLHAISDYVKARFTRDEWFAFTLDQLVHLLLIIFAAIWLSAKADESAETIIGILLKSKKVYLYLCG